MKSIYCTLFNHKYLSRGLALFESLQKQNDKIELYIVAMDDIAFSKLIIEKPSNIIVISISDIEKENPDMLVAKGNRSATEYCWTCTSCVIHYIITHYNCDTCTYLDADIYFYQNPGDALDKLKNYTTMLVPHLFSKKESDSEKLCGKYCVEFVPFKKEKKSLEILEHWRRQCLEWCYNKHEDGKFGDQKYIEEWDKRDDVYISRNHGMGVAPWNAGRFDLIKNDAGFYDLIDLENNMQKCSLFFYHFSQLKLFDKDVVCLDYCHRLIPDRFREELYAEYLKTLEMVNEKYHLRDGDTDYNATEHFRSEDLDNLMHEYNYFRKSTLLEERKQDI
ncbi:glycosyl transferase [Bacteroides congonensis]|uniref:glycosyl transferase n=1 Tax=Bacteroides congonensis TaxID=1871006 RepID=UPI00321AA84C